MAISGWRFNDHDVTFLYRPFRRLVLAKTGDVQLWFRIGDCRGGTDAAAKMWLEKHFPQFAVYEADWDKHRPGSPDARNPAGPIRNRAMLKGDHPTEPLRGRMADELWCWPEPGPRKPNSGTWDCFDAAVELNIHTVVMKRG